MRPILPTFLMAVAASANPTPERLALSSRHLSARLQADVYLPGDYGTSPGRRYPMCLLLHGGGGSASDLRGAGLADLATRHRIIIVAPDAGQSLFVDPITGDGDCIESAVLKDLLPELDRRYRTIPTRRGRMVGGISFGGYAALRFGILYPAEFTFVASLSGVVEAPRWNAAEEPFLPPAIRDPMKRAFGPAGSERRRQRDLFFLVDALSPEARRSLPFLQLDCGIEDMFLPSNQRFAALLSSLGIRHEFRPSPGKHDGEYWRRQLQEVLGQGVRLLKPDPR